MGKRRRSFDDAVAPLRALNWQELPPPEQRALFSQLTEIVLAMMGHDLLPDGRFRRTNADRARRAAENEDKLALISMAYESLIVEGLSDDQFRQLLLLFKAASYAMDAFKREQTPMPKHGV